ncbi:MAG TPA: hypothetical protein V6C71_00100 [Coleofasciculaceae cyanobacterium]
MWTSINYYLREILAVEIGCRSGQTFRKLWRKIKAWNSNRLFNRWILCLRQLHRAKEA